MIPLCGAPTLPWAVRPGKLRPRAAQSPNSWVRRRMFVLGSHALAVLLAFKLQCSCWRHQAERYLCPAAPPETP